MPSDLTIPPDPEGLDDVWDAPDWSGADYEERAADAAAREQAAFDAPDTLDHLIEVADLMTIQAAQRLVQVNLLHREALADASRHGRGFSDVVDRSVRIEIASALRITESAAGGLLALAEALVDRYPTVLESFCTARMTERHAEILVGALESLEPELHGEILPRAIELAETQPVGAFRRALRKLVEAVRVATLAERHEEALRARRVVVEPAEDGMAWFSALVPAVEAHAIFGRVTAIAKVLGTQEGETRTLDQLRADVFGDILIEGEMGGHPAESRGIRATVVVTVPALSLLEEHPVLGADPATVEGVGPIPTARARELCGGADGWMRVLTHPETGMVLSVGRDQYRPPPSLRRLVRWRADRCMAPGCGMPAARCEIDHTMDWQLGGHTSLENNAPICKGHHIVKHHGGWCVQQIRGSGGALEWTSPTGRRYVVEPERRVPVFHPQAEGVAPF